MKKSAKWGLGIILFFVLLIILVAILPSPKSSKVQELVAQKAATQKAEEIKKAKVSLPQVTLNYKDHATVTHQQIISAIKEGIAEELKLEDLNWSLKKVEIKDKKISVYLDLQFEPQSKSWIVKEGKTWLSHVTCQELRDNNGSLIGNVYSTGYDISVLLWTWFEADGSEVLPWGHAILFNSGKPFTNQSVAREGKWIDGAGMKMFK